MNVIRLTAVAATLVATATVATAAERHVCLFAGDSTTLGPAVDANYQPLTLDQAIRLYAEVGQLSTASPPDRDMFTNEYPTPTEGPNLVRWLQTVPRTTMTLAPIPVAGVQRVGAWLQFARYMHSWKGATYNTTIATFAFGGSAMEGQWFHSISSDLSSRFIEFISELQLKMAQEGDTFVPCGLIISLGANDIWDASKADLFAFNLDRLIFKVRGYLNAPTLPVILVKPHVLQQENNAAYNLIRSDVDDKAATDACTGEVFEDDLQHDGTLAHFTVASTNTIGQRIFNVMATVMGRVGCPAPIARPRR